MEPKDSNTKYYIIATIVLIIIIIGFLVYNIIVRMQTKEEIPQQNTIIQPEQDVTEKLKSMEEYERIKYYLNQYITYLENGNYEQAYEYLYPDFKNTYFPTLETYKTYVQKKYPPVVSIEYTDLIRLGTYYVMDITFIDVINMTEENKPGFTQKIIVYEKALNDFTISFQAE